MDWQNKRDILRQAYDLNPFKVHNVIRFTKQKSKITSAYPTIHGAFIFPIEGEAEIWFDDSCFAAKPGVLVHGCPGRQLRFNVYSQTPFVYINIYYRQINSDLLFSAPVNLPQIEPALQMLAAKNDDTDIYAILQKKLLTEQVFRHIFYDDNAENLTGEYHYVSEILAYIKENYQKPIRMQHLASLIGKSESQMSYLFYKHTRQRPIDFLIDYRVDMAANLLSEQGYQVNEAAEAVGYSDPLYFSRVFKRRTGYTPKQVRKKL